MRVFSFDHDDDLAARIARTEPRDRVHSPLQREALGDRRLDAAVEIERHERRDIGGMLPGLARGELSPEHTDDLATLEQGEIERQLRDTGGKADDEIASLPPDRAQRRFGVITAPGSKITWAPFAPQT